MERRNVEQLIPEEELLNVRSADLKEQRLSSAAVTFGSRRFSQQDRACSSQQHVESDTVS